jgi:hypothetical protein
MAVSRCRIALAGVAAWAVLLAALPSVVVADAVTLDKPIYTEVFVQTDAARNPKIAGNLLSYDDESLTIKTPREEKTLRWAELTPNSAFLLRQRLIDKTKAGDWLTLGRFGWSIGAKDQAKTALKTAVQLDADLKPQADEIQSRPAGEARAPTKPVADPAAEPELIQSGDGTVAQPGRKGEPVERVKYVPATPEEHAAAIAAAREKKLDVEEELRIKLVEIETEHFIIFTDWDAREHNFLKQNLEDAYRVVSKQFDMSPKENIFVGKLPVYMWARYADFKRFGQKIDSFGVSETVAGYYRGTDDGLGHMSMWKPNQSMTGTSSIKDAEKLWGYVLVHEFTHAFIARYRSNERIPRWLNEGIAEVIASSQIPYPRAPPLRPQHRRRGPRSVVSLRRQQHAQRPVLPRHAIDGRTARRLRPQKLHQTHRHHQGRRRPRRSARADL